MTTAFAGATGDSVRVLADLQSRLAGVTNVQTDFVQEKRLAVLDREVIVRGRLVVQLPDRVAWQVSEPMRYRLVIDGDRLRQWDEVTGAVQQTSLAGNPVFGVIARQMRGWLAGRLDALADDFVASLDTEGPRPRVVFTPRPGSFAQKAVKRVVLTPREDGRYMEAMRIEEIGGDTTFMRFTNTVLNAAIDPAAWEVRPHAR